MILLATQYRRSPDGSYQPTVDLEPADGKIYDMTPCRRCEEFMRRGIILIPIDQEKSPPGWDHQPDGDEYWMPNPWRMGTMFVVKEDYIRRLMKDHPKIRDLVLRRRWSFIPEEVARWIGLYDAEPTDQTPSGEAAAGDSPPPQDK